MFSYNYFTFVSLIIFFVILFNLTGQLCQLGDFNGPFNSSIDSPFENGSSSLYQLASHKHDPSTKKKHHQPARHLVRPFYLNPKVTWKAFQMNNAFNEAKDEENRKVQAKKRNKLRKLLEKMKKAALISKKLVVLLNDISTNLDPEF